MCWPISKHSTTAGNGLDKCRSPPVIHYLAIIDKARKQKGLERIETVNSGVNTALHFQSDWSQYREPDKWASPLESFRSGRGDCEDFATAKVVALYAAGTPLDDLWLVLGFDKAVQQHHMIAAVRLDGRWLLLENRTMVMFEDKDYPNFDLLFLINHESVREIRRPVFTIDGVLASDRD
jgi:predicted transglutaminase-like cysteine proteinase